MTVGSSAYEKLQVRALLCVLQEKFTRIARVSWRRNDSKDAPSPPTLGDGGVELPLTPGALTFECGTSFTDAVHCVSNSTCEGEDVICLQVLLGAFSSSIGIASVAGRQPDEGAGV